MKLAYIWSIVLALIAASFSGCAALGLATTATPAGARVRLEGRHSVDEIERGIEAWETFGYTASKEEAERAYVAPDKIPRWPSRQEWVTFKAKMRPKDQLWYFYGGAHGWCLRRAGQYVEFLIFKDSAEGRSAIQSPEATPVQRRSSTPSPSSGAPQL